jgi:hypothetical protein
MIGFINSRHATLPKLFDDPIWTNVLTDVEGHSFSPLAFFSIIAECGYFLEFVRKLKCVG